MQGANPARRGTFKLANAFPDGWGKIPNNPLIAAAIASLFKGGSNARDLMGGWVPDAEGRLTYRHLGKRGGQIVIYPDTAAVIARQNGSGIDKQWAFVEGFSPLTVDVLLAILAQVCEPSLGNKPKFPLLAPVPITASAILRYKDLRRWGSEGRQLRQRVDEEILRLQGLRFDVHQFPAWDPDMNRWNAKGVSVIGDRLFDIVDSQTYQRGGETRSRSEIVWLTRIGHWSQWWMNAQAKVWMGAIPRRILEFDHRRNRGSSLLAKKISLNTMVLWGAVRSRGSMERRIDHLLEDIGELPNLDARDSHWGGRVRDRFDEAILQLQEDGIFGHVEWPQGHEPGGADRVKGWVEAWLASKIVLTRPGVFGDNAVALRRKKKRRVARQSKEPAELRRGSVIRSMRMDRNITQSRFAGELGISAAYLSQIENEKRAVSKVLLGRIAEWARANEDSSKPVADATGSVHSLDAARDSRPAIGFRG
jgi:DNA-binding XRE family transcriptional regulator